MSRDEGGGFLADLKEECGGHRSPRCKRKRRKRAAEGVVGQKRHCQKNPTPPSRAPKRTTPARLRSRGGGERKETQTWAGDELEAAADRVMIGLQRERERDVLESLLAHTKLRYHPIN